MTIKTIEIIINHVSVNFQLDVSTRITINERKHPSLGEDGITHFDGNAEELSKLLKRKR